MLIALFTASLSQAQVKPVYKSLLWEITGNGLTKPSYLYGTMHVSSKLAFHLTDTFYMGINNCDVVALEMNPDTWMADLVKSETVSDANSMMRDFGYYGAKNFYRKAVELNIPDRKTIAYSLAEDPSLVNGMLYRFDNYSVNYEEDTYLDLFIYQAGKKLKKRVSELEGFEESMELAQKAMLPDENPETKLKKYKSYLDGANIQEQIEDAYRQGDLDRLDSLSRETQTTKNYQKYLIDERNIIMARNLDSLLRSNSVFAAIGAAHLPGDAGVISLLRQKGYTVRPVTNHVTRKSIQTKGKLEKMRVPLAYTKQYSPDSAFSVDMPGKLYELPSYSDIKQYLYPEMMNGVYFSVSRIRTLSPLTGKNEQYIQKSLDSILYESVPGKILKRESITSNSQYPGFDITTKTRRGDILRYKIFISPLEVFLFKMGGTGEYVKDEGEKFFGSIKFNTPVAGNWKKYSPASGGYEIDMPGKVMAESNKSNYKGERQDEVVQAMDAADKSYYLVLRSSLHDFDYIEEDTFELGQIANELREQLECEVVDRKLTTVNGYPAIDVKMKGKNNGFVYLRSVINGPHYYSLIARTANEQFPSKFFDSFRFKELTYEKPFESYKDTTLHFTVNTVVLPPSKSSMSSLTRSYLYNMYRDRNKKKEDDSYLGKQQRKTYYSPSTAEAIMVKYEKFHKFYSADNKDKFWDKQVKELSGQATYFSEDMPMAGDNDIYQQLSQMYGSSGNMDAMVIRSKKFSEQNGLQVMDVLLTDTNSTRAIKGKMVLKQGVLYTLLANIDTIGQPSAWTKTFFETFTPGDTLMGESLFADKTPLFFSYLSNADTVLKKQAMKSVYTVSLDDKHAPELLKYMKSADFKKQELDLRASLISRLAALKHPDILPFLKKTYVDAADTTTLQLAVLRGLGSQQTDKAISLFMELLNIETPLTSNDYEITSIFSNLRDSLQLAKKMYPGLFAYTRYPEYEDNVYSLLSTLVDSGYVDKAMYASEKSMILKKANEEVKRQLASEENRGSEYGESEYYEDYGYYDDYNYGNYKLDNYSTLLIPFMQEPGVKNYFDKLARSKDDNLRMSTAILMLRKNQQVPDSIWKKYSADAKYRISLYRQLKAAKHLEKFDAQYNNQLDLSRALLYGLYQTADDSIQFVEKRLVSTRGSKGYVYFFKSKFGKDDGWHLDYIALQPENEKEVDIDNIFSDRGDLVFNEKDTKEEMDRVVKQLTLRGRKRVGGNDLGMNYFQDLLGQ